MPQIERPEGTDYGMCRVLAFPSSSRVGRKHYTIVTPANGVQCGCEGWQNHGHCWHIESLTEEQLELVDGNVDGFQIKLGTALENIPAGEVGPVELTPEGLEYVMKLLAANPVVEEEEGPVDG